jgi:protein kinase C-binding protein NELL
VRTQGDLQDVHLIPGPYGYLKQCENMDAQCPTCGQFLQLQNALVELNKSFRQLSQRVSWGRWMMDYNFAIFIATVLFFFFFFSSIFIQLVAAEDRVSYLEDCDCKKSCSINGTTKEDGAEWFIGCTVCKCKRGTITCDPIPCEPVKCKNPVLEDGQCCPKCLSESHNNF